MRIGVISDTHGLLRPEAVAALAGVDHILHAGDVGDAAILDALSEIAPLTAIRGNIDRSGRCSHLPTTEMVELEGSTFYLLHDVNELDLDPIAAGVGVVVSGHSHQPSIDRRKSVLYLNPGSAGARRCRVNKGDRFEKGIYAFVRSSYRLKTHSTSWRNDEQAA